MFAGGKLENDAPGIVSAVCVRYLSDQCAATHHRW
jgi:hypothetical protein